MAVNPTEGRVFFLQENGMELIDIHCHILPMVDDGPESAEEALQILEEMRAQRVDRAIVTPHYRREMFEPSMKKVLYAYKWMRRQAADRGIQLRLGCEYYREEQMVEKLNCRRRPTMAGGSYVLVEFSTNDMFSTIRNYIYELTAHGYRPIIAHVERYFACQQLDRVKELKNMGARIQINAGSVLGESGWRMKRFCLELMRADVVDFIASDTHNTGSRKLNLKRCASYVTRKMGKIYTKKVFYDNPLQVWRNR